MEANSQQIQTNNTTQQIKDKETLNFRCEQFFAKNWKYIFYSIAISIVVIAWEIYSINQSMKKLEITVYENTNKVVLTTSDGRAIKVTKTPLKAENFKQYATTTFVNNFIVGRMQLTKNLTINKFEKVADILNNAPNLVFIYKDYINKEDKKALGFFNSYIQWLMSAVAQDKLPEFFAMKNYDVKIYEYEENRFNIEININVVAQSYFIAKNEYITQNGIVNIKAKGTFNIDKSTDANPYGMLISDFKITIPTKNN